MSKEEETQAQLPKPGDFVYHQEHRLFGEVTKVHQAGTYVARGGERPMACAVVEIEGAGSFVADRPELFVKVPDGATDFAANVIGATRELVNGGLQNAKTFGLPAWLAFELLAFALEKTAFELHAAANDDRPRGDRLEP